jgi:hypothetical protein
MEESQTGAGGGIPSSLLESGQSFKVAGRVQVSGPILGGNDSATAQSSQQSWQWHCRSDLRGKKC